MSGKTRIFMGLGNIAGYFSKLKAGFDEIGVDSYLFDVSVDVFLFNKSNHNIYIKILKYLRKQRAIHNNKIIKILLILIYKILLLPMFFWSIIKFDVFIFGFNHTFYRLYDLPILKFFGKKIILVYFGSDSRPPYMSGIDIVIKKSSASDLVLKAKKVKHKIEIVERYADFIINSPVCGQFHEKNFINWMCIGMPTVFENDNLCNSLKYKKNNEIRIVHAPTRPITKGSTIFYEIIKKLKQKYNINYIELVNKPNAEVLLELQRCDFVLDEMYSDVSVGGLSSEAASYKKISIVGGYYSEEMYNDAPIKYLPPSLYCQPSEIEEAIVNLIENRNKAYSLGEELHDFILENWNSKVIANKFLMLINDNYPSEWIYNTNSNRYIYGYGISKEELKKQYSDIYDKFGIESFQLKHNVELEKKILEFIND